MDADHVTARFSLTVSHPTGKVNVLAECERRGWHLVEVIEDAPREDRNGSCIRGFRARGAGSGLEDGKYAADGRDSKRYSSRTTLSARCQRLDILATNQLGRALFSELYAAPARSVNNARFVFLDRRAEVFYGDWEWVAGECVAILRWAAGRDPHDRDLSDLVGELATPSEAFRTPGPP